MSKFQLTPVTGLPQVNGWAQVISHPSGSMFCVLAVQGQNANSIGKNLTEFILTQDITTSASLHHSLLDLLQKARAELCKIQLSCLVLSENNKVIAATHSGSVFLKRNFKIGEILSSTGELKIIEGVLKEGDTFTLATEDAKNTFNNLKEKLINKTEIIATDLVSELQENPDSSLIALGFLEQIEEKNLKPTIKKSNGIDINQKATNLIKKVKKVNLKKLISFPKKVASRINFSQEKIDIEQQNNLQLFLKIAFFLITVFVAVIFWKQQTIKRELEPITPVLENIDQKFEQLKNNDQASELELRNESRNLLKKLEDLISQNKDNKYSLEEIKKHYQQIQEFSESISGVETQGPLDPFFDLRLSEPEFIEKQTSLTKQNLFSLDASGKYGIFLNLKNKQTTKFNLEAVGGAKAIALNEDYLFILGNGLHSFKINNPESHQQLKEEGDSDRGGTMIKTYGSYIYVFNPEKRNIYRYLLKDDELSEPIGWLVDKQDLDFSIVESMAIDGDLWLTDKEGQIFKYTQGQKQDFSPKDLPSELGKAIKISTTEENDYLYILDNENQKVIILQKDGQFVKEISSESLSSGGSIVALDEKQGALVISGSLIYQIFP